MYTLSDGASLRAYRPLYMGVGVGVGGCQPPGELDLPGSANGIIIELTHFRVFVFFQLSNYRFSWVDSVAWLQQENFQGRVS